METGHRDEITLDIISDLQMKQLILLLLLLPVDKIYLGKERKVGDESKQVMKPKSQAFLL